MANAQESVEFMRRVEDDGHTGSSAPAADYLMSAVGMKPELVQADENRTFSERPSVADSMADTTKDNTDASGYDHQDALSRESVERAAGAANLPGTQIKSKVVDEPETEGYGQHLKAQLKQKLAGSGDKGNSTTASTNEDQPGLGQRATNAVSSMFGSAKAMETKQKAGNGGVHEEKTHTSLLHKLGFGKDELEGQDPHPELTMEPEKRSAIGGSKVHSHEGQHKHDTHHAAVAATTAVPTAVSKEAHKERQSTGGAKPDVHDAIGKEPAAERESFAHRLGFGKDALEGEDPHPEVNVDKPTVGGRASTAWNSMFGNAKAMEHQAAKPTGTTQQPEKAEHKTLKQKLGIGKDEMDGSDPHPELTVDGNKPTLKEKAKGAWGSMFGNAKAMENELDQLARKPRAAETEPHSNVEKVSPFTGPLDGDAAGALNSVPAGSTGGLAPSDVKAPSVWDRTKEEFEAVGEALKEVVTGGKK